MNWEGVGKKGGKGETLQWIAEDSWKSEKGWDPHRGQKMALGRNEEFHVTWFSFPLSSRGRRLLGMWTSLRGERLKDRGDQRKFENIM